MYSFTGVICIPGRQGGQLIPKSPAQPKSMLTSSFETSTPSTPPTLLRQPVPPALPIPRELVEKEVVPLSSPPVLTRQPSLPALPVP